ncbi:chorion protein S38 [Episyrphus balteatus]|uniref:chorion protein S38 n=1 Tax=Episyrphus balteatus TaxID=286459 RepID=UPI0024867863|nr:chorion protein S38 [Episyrphus balteatus]
MNTFSLLFQVVIAIVAVNCQQQFVQQFPTPCSGNVVGQFDQQLLDSQSGAAASASASSDSSSQNSLFSNNGQLVTGPGAVSGPIVGGIGGPIGGPLAGSIGGPLSGPLTGPIGGGPSASQYNYAAVDPRAQSSQVSQSYFSNKGEILVHRPAPIVVKRPPTKVLVNHPPLVVRPAPVVLHKPPPVILRKVFIKQQPRPVKVEPVYVNVVKPPAEKYYVNEKASQGPAGVGYNQLQNGPAYYSGPAQYGAGPAQFVTGPGQYAAGPAQFAAGPGQFVAGPAQFAAGPGQFIAGPGQFAAGPGQYLAGPAQFVTGPGQYSFQNQQGQSQAQAQAQADAQAQSQNQQQFDLQSDTTNFQYGPQVQPPCGCNN